MEPFGANEKAFSEEEREILTRYLKYDDHVPLKIAEMVYSAEVEAEYFAKAGKLVGSIATVGFFFFPIIRQLPAFRRIALSLIPGATIYAWGNYTKNELQWGKTFAAYQKFVMYHGQHSKIFI